MARLKWGVAMLISTWTDTILATTNLQPDLEKLTSHIQPQNRIRIFRIYC